MPAYVNNVVIHKNYQFALEFPIFALKLNKKATKSCFYKKVANNCAKIMSTKIIDCLPVGIEVNIGCG